MDTYWMTFVLDISGVRNLGGKTGHVIVEVSFIIDRGYYLSQTSLERLLLAPEGGNAKAVAEEQSFIEGG